MNPDRHNSHPAAQESEISDRLLTIPNLLCLVRLAGSFVLLPIAWQGNSSLFLWVFIALAMTDWLDGKLAIWLNQRSLFGARLDSWADAALYAALTFGAIVLYGHMLGSEITLLVAALASYGLTTITGFVKYRRWPSYHTRAAKASWLFILIATVSLFSGWSLWPLRIALLAIILTNLEAFFITLLSPVWRANVTSIYHVWRDNRT